MIAPKDDIKVLLGFLAETIYAVLVDKHIDSQKILPLRLNF
jgi:hypothetical protein